MSLSDPVLYHLFYLYKGAGWIGGKGIAIQGLSSNAIHNLLFRYRHSTNRNALSAPLIRHSV